MNYNYESFMLEQAVLYAYHGGAVVCDGDSLSGKVYRYEEESE